ncbi:MAG: ABC transporter substrate-binding protein [Thermoleophilia bacterium]|nr:ABC transporter substrate-binding protein [Thermoleophilia bacterium]
MHRTLAALVALAALLTVPSAVAADPFPVTLQSPAGEVTIRRQPRRIVSLSPTATETLFAIGAGRQVVAVDDQSDFPRRAPRTRLSGFTPNAEAVAGYRPDLVIVHFDANRIVASLRRLGIPVLVQPPARDLRHAYAQIRQLGRATGRRTAANALAARLRTRIGRIVAQSRPRARRHSVYHEVSPDLYAASSRTFVGSIYRRFGFRNVADAADTGSGYPKLSSEYLIARNPSLIVLADTVCCGQSRATVAARPGWDRIRAVRTGAVVRLHDSLASRWGPRILNFVQALARALRTVPR